MRKSTRKLQICRETLTNLTLDPAVLRAAAGGLTNTPICSNANICTLTCVNCN